MASGIFFLMQCGGDSSVKDFLVHATVNVHSEIWEYAVSCQHVTEYISSRISSVNSVLADVVGVHLGKCEIRTIDDKSLILDFAESGTSHNMLSTAARLESDPRFEVSYPSASSIQLYCPQMVYDGPRLVFTLPKLRFSEKGSVKLRDPVVWSREARYELSASSPSRQARKLVCRLCAIPTDLQEQILVIPYITNFFIGSAKPSSDAETNSEELEAKSAACVMLESPPTPRHHCCFMGKH